MMQKNILAVDMGGSKLLAGIVSPEGKVLSVVRAELPRTYDASLLKSALLSLLDQVDTSSCVAAGVSLPGLADSKTGTLLYAPFSGIRNFKAAQIISDRTKLSAAGDNDVNACAVGEARFGVCQNVSDFLWVTVSNGIGGSIFANGALYTGSAGNAGEVGHLCVVPNGRKCGCGRKGCLEAEAAGPAISAAYEKKTGRVVSAKELAGLAETDRAAKAVWNRTGYLLGKGIYMAANILNPEKIVIGGGVSMAFSLLTPGLNKARREFLFSDANPHLTVVPTGLGYHASLLGAAALACGLE